jgi:hypothetical protein
MGVSYGVFQQLRQMMTHQMPKGQNEKSKGESRPLAQMQINEYSDYNSRMVSVGVLLVMSDDHTSGAQRPK